MLVFYFILELGPVLFPAKKYADGLFYVELPTSEFQGNKEKLVKRATTSQLIEIQKPDFLIDETSISGNEQCVGIFADALDPGKMYLRTIDCAVKSLVFFETPQGSNESISERGLPSLPCIQNERNGTSQTKRKKRSPSK